MQPNELEIPTSKTIILEGPDGSGKTTLAKTLNTEHGFEYVHTGPPKPGEDLLISYATALEQAIYSDKNIVMDRSHLGESVYGPIFRGVDRITMEGQIILNRICAAGAVKHIICLPPYEVAVNNWRKNQKNELIKNQETYLDIYLLYRRFLKRSFLTPYLLTWDYTRIPLESAVATLSNIDVERRKLPKGVIGSPDARFLFVGEIANQETLDLPWIALGNSSHYLFECIRDAGYEERDICFTNVKKLDGTLRPVRAIHDYIGRDTHVIALGKETSRLIARSVPHSTVPHPAYWKRFHSSQQAVYTNMLKQIRIESYGTSSSGG